MKMSGIVDDLRYQYKNGSMMIKLLFINILVYLAVNIIILFLYLFGLPLSDAPILNYLALPADVHQIFSRPWTLVTYMFLHVGFLHILFNMLWFYWFGRIFLSFFSNNQLLRVYLVGGMVGALFYILSYNFFPVFQTVLPISKALGASAAVLAVVVAVSTYVPDYTIHLMFIGPVRLKYIALFTVVLDILSIPSGNAGGHIAHLGGAAFGFLFAHQMHKHNDVTTFLSGIFTFISDIFNLKPKTKFKVHKNKYKTKDDWEYNARKNLDQKRIDKILDKIAESGYNSLTKEEKDLLFHNSKN